MNTKDNTLHQAFTAVTEYYTLLENPDNNPNLRERQENNYNKVEETVSAALREGNTIRDLSATGIATPHFFQFIKDREDRRAAMEAEVAYHEQAAQNIRGYLN